MDFSALSFMRPSPQNQQMMDEESSSMDSITLGQLKSMVGPQPKQRQQRFDFRYDDEDTVFNEIDEFFSYVEVPQYAENMRAWEGSFNGEWTKSSLADRKAHVELLLESLEHRDAEKRFVNARRLLYILQGTFAETTSPEHQLHWIIDNAKLVRSADGLSRIVDAIKISSSKHDVLSNISESDTRHLGISQAEKQDFIEEVNTELSMYYAILYFMVEVMKGDEDFGDELMSLDPPLPTYLFGLVASLKEKSLRGYPVKKLLLVLWKSLLTCLGGIKELDRVKKLGRELAGLREMEQEQAIKSTPIDFSTFRHESAVKYPTFVPAAPKSDKEITIERLSTALSPIPVRPPYHQAQSEQNQSGHPIHDPMQMNMGTGMGIGTPAPSPPPHMQNPNLNIPNPKLKKLQFQTDQTRPFVFPFSRTTGTVPIAVEEAERLYKKHMHISLALWQMWEVREACWKEESGVDGSVTFGNAANKSVASTGMGGEKGSGVSVGVGNGVGVGVPSSFGRSEDVVEGVAGPSDIKKLELLIQEVEEALNNGADTGGKERRKLREKKQDLIRLRRIESIYSAILPLLQPCVIVLLKLLLATVTATGGPPPNSSQSGFSVNEMPMQPPPSPEEIDVMRHREITSKAVSAILMLTLKWFKASHIMKFHHLGQLLLDSNCILLVLKMFGMQEVSSVIVAKNEIPEFNFFRFCNLNFSRNATAERPEDNMLSQSSQPPRVEDDVELITDFSWRNFFANINFVKIVQKLSKGRSHRIWLLVQYKSSAILKRILKVTHPILQLHVLKLLKSQVPYCGRKWRQSNMKVITLIYLHCRPDLRDEWLSGAEVDDVVDAMVQEQALRTLVKFYNTKRYGTAAATLPSQQHRRNSSQSAPTLDALGVGGGGEIPRPHGTPSTPAEADVFPPLKSRVADPSHFLPFIPEDAAFEAEYEEYLSDLGERDNYQAEAADALFQSVSAGGPAREEHVVAGDGGESAWRQLSKISSELADGISDSESIGSINILGDESRSDSSDASSVDENHNNWAHMSPKTLSAMPKSPVGRRSSSGTGLRPVLPFGLDDGTALEEDVELPSGPVPRTGQFSEGEGVDEVESATDGSNNVIVETHAQDGTQFGFNVAHILSYVPSVKRGMADQCIMESPPTQVRKPSVIDTSESARLAQRIEQLEALVRASYGQANMSEADMAALLSANPAVHDIIPQPRPVPERAVQDAAAALGQLSQGAGDNPLAALFSQFGATKPHPLDEPNPADPVASFPASPHVTGQLARYFFEASSIHWYCVAVHKPVFYDAYLEFFSGRPQTVPDLDFCVLLAAMCALTLQFCGDADAQAILAESALDRDALRQKMFHFARTMLAHSERTQGPTLERISAMILITIYLENEGNMIEYYATIGSAIRTAQSMGMHRDGETKWHMNPVEAEQRRRLWWILYTYDRLQNFVLCRPYIIHNSHCDCRLPLNADQAELIEERELISHPINQPTEHTFQLLQINWARVVGDIFDHCFSILMPTYRTILHMEHEIRIFEHSLPIAFRPGSGETGARPYILFQNQTLMLQVHHAKILLLRPFVFKRDVPPYEPENQQHQELFDQYACDVCIQVCKRLLAFQQVMHSQSPRHQLRWFLCVNSAFDAALTLASVLVLQPNHPLAEDIDYWVRAGQRLLRSMSSFHHVASESVKALHIVRNRSLSARGLPLAEEDGFNAPPVPMNVSSQHYSPQHPHHLFDPLLSAEMDRAHRTLAQSPVLVADSLGPPEMNNAIWDTLVAQVFETGVLPSSVEMLSGEFDPEDLFERFL
ncbi:striatin-interacting protein 1 [Ceratobasidium sp. AG-Ba]|nr:striatin-interacting protein 1 [Ceratobasidium sp. AG-Ba]